MQIKKQDVCLDVDFEADQVAIEAELTATLRIGQILSIVVITGIEYLKLRKQFKRQLAGPGEEERKDKNG